MKIIRRLKAGAIRRLPSRKIARALIARADHARDHGRFAEAAPLYEEAVRLAPRLAGIHIQAGHMRKEIGDFDAALAHYRRAAEMLPHSAELALQLGHFFQRTGQHDEAITAYREALSLDPSLADAEKSLHDLERHAAMLSRRQADRADASWLAVLERGLVPELLPEHAVPPDADPDRIHVHRAGGPSEAGPFGHLPTLRRVAAVRGSLVSRTAYDTVAISLDGQRVGTERPDHRSRADGAVDHVFNVWIDTRGHRPGPATLEIRLSSGPLGGPVATMPVVIASVGDDPALLARDDIIARPPPDDTDPEAWIRSLPSEVRVAGSIPGQTRLRAVLVLRTDQLGDLIVSVPALTRLRALAGDAKLIGLVTSANKELAVALNLFDQVLVADFPKSAVSGARVMLEEDQASLRQRLHEYRFDAAIDLGISHVSRPLLLLTGAARLFGTPTGRWPWLDAMIDGPPPVSADTALPHSERLLRIVEYFGSAVGAIARREIVRRDTDDSASLARLGLDAKPYVVLHEAVGHPHNRWPGFSDLIGSLLAGTSFDIVFLTDSAERRTEATALDHRHPGRFRLLDQRMSFDSLDAILAHATAFVGIDSGPKHLASLRGVPVVSIHASRSDWREWGQEQTGVIVSRRVPCAGCGVGFDDHACGKAFACITDIKADEVYSCLLSLLHEEDQGHRH